MDKQATKFFGLPVTLWGYRFKPQHEICPHGWTQVPKLACRIIVAGREQIVSLFSFYGRQPPLGPAASPCTIWLIAYCPLPICAEFLSQRKTSAQKRACKHFLNTMLPQPLLSKLARPSLFVTASIRDNKNNEPYLSQAPYFTRGISVNESFFDKKLRVYSRCPSLHTITTTYMQSTPLGIIHQRLFSNSSSW